MAKSCLFRQLGIGKSAIRVAGLCLSLSPQAHSAPVSMSSSPGEMCQVSWEHLVNPPVLALAGDTVYYGIRFVPQDDDLVLELQGTMPNARYVSLTSYLPNANAFDSRFDAQIERGPDGQSYQISMIAAGTESMPPMAQGGNTLLRPSVQTADVSKHGVTIWYRAYVPYGDQDSIQPPTIRAVSRRSGQASACPKFISSSSPVDFLAVQRAATLPNAELEVGLIDSFHVSADYDYQNKQNGYLNARLDYHHADDVAVFAFRAPRASEYFSAQNPDSSWSEADVRLYSMSVVNFLGINQGTLHDSQLSKRQDSDSAIPDLVTVLVGNPQDRDLQAYAQAHQWGFLPKSKGNLGHDILIYRQQAANVQPVGRDRFLGHVQTLVPVCSKDASKNPQSCAGRCYIGAYAPRGRICTKADVLADRCTVPIDDSRACTP